MAKDNVEFRGLESFFTPLISSGKLPQSMQLDSGTFIPDVTNFVTSYLNSLRSGEMSQIAAGGRFYRLQLLKSLLERNG